MLKIDPWGRNMIVNVAIFGAFLLIVSVLTFFLWQTLFAPEEYGDSHEQPAIAQSQQQGSTKNTLGASTTPSTHNPTEEAIAHYTKWLAIFTLFLVLATIALFVSGERNIEVARKSAGAAKDSADAANRSAKIAEDTLVATNRPWVSVDLAIAGPLTYNETEARLEIAFVLRNTGSSPAVNVQVDAEIALFMDNGKTPLDVMKEICKRAKESPDDNAVLGHTIFKDREFIYSINMGKTKSGIGSAFDNFKHMEKGKNEWFVPVIVGCASYRFPFQKGRHTSEFIADLRKINPQNAKAPLSFKISDGNVATKDMVLTRSFIGGNAD